MKSILMTWLMTGLLTVAAATTSNAQTTTTTTSAAIPAADSTNLSAYTGAYTFESGSPVNTFAVTAEKGDLYGEADNLGKNKLLKQDKADTYQSTSSYGSIITFGRDATTKAVTGLVLSAQGTTISAKKKKP